jgi:hypothetical protein
MMEAMPLDDGDSARVTTCSSCNETVLTNASTVKVSNVQNRTTLKGADGQACSSDETSPQFVAMRRDLSIRTYSVSRAPPFCFRF